MTMTIQNPIILKQTSDMSLKDTFVAFMFKTLSKPYLRFFKAKKQAWNIKKADLLLLPTHSLGFHIGSFLDANGYELEPKMEEHDVYHVLSGTPTRVVDEIRLQYYMLGNGKRSIFLYIVLLTGIVLYHSQLSSFRNSYHKGKASLPFWHINFYDFLHTPIDTIISKYNIQSNQN